MLVSATILVLFNIIGYNMGKYPLQEYNIDLYFIAIYGVSLVGHYYGNVDISNLRYTYTTANIMITIDLLLILTGCCINLQWVINSTDNYMNNLIFVAILQT